MYLPPEAGRFIIDLMDKRWEEITHNIEQEVKKMVEYVDQQVVPTARKEAETALRHVAGELEKLADKLKK